MTVLADLRKAVESLNAAAARDLERATQMGAITVAQSRRDAFGEVLALVDAAALSPLLLVPPKENA